MCGMILLCNVMSDKLDCKMITFKFYEEDMLGSGYDVTLGYSSLSKRTFS